MSFKDDTQNITLNTSSELTNKDGSTMKANDQRGPPGMTKYVSAEPDQPSCRKSIAKIPTNKLVDEIAEVINDASPTIAKTKVVGNGMHMGFQPVNESSA